MIRKKKGRYRMAVNLTVEFNAYVEYQPQGEMSHDAFLSALMKEAIDSAINPDYSEQRHIRITDVVLGYHKAWPLNVPYTFASVQKQLGKDNEAQE